MALAAAACIHLQPTNCCPALDSSLHSTASSTASTTIIGSAVATTLSTAASLFSDDSVVFSLLLPPPRVDARQAICVMPMAMQLGQASLHHSAFSY